MVVVALRGSNIPVLPVPEYNSVLFLLAKLSAYSYRNADEDRAEVPPDAKLLSGCSPQSGAAAPTWSINETE